MIHVGDCLEVMRTLEANSFDSIVTDPPYHLTTGKKGGTGPASVNLESPYGRARIGTGFMGKAWDGGDIAFRPETWAEALRVAKPGAYLAAFGGTRTSHRLACAIEDAGWELRDTLMWLYGSGFPKSKNPCTCKPPVRTEAIDAHGWRLCGSCGKQYELGTALKPAWEPIVLARKPLIGTVDANVLVHGTGALNIDGCRVEGEPVRIENYQSEGANGCMSHGHGGGNGHAGKERSARIETAGRWPANVVHDGSEEVVALFPREAGAAAPVHRRNADKSRNTFGAFSGQDVDEGGNGFQGDRGSAARFFYCPKASVEDRDAGLEQSERRAVAYGNQAQAQAQVKRGNIDHTGNSGMNTVKLRGNHHPTVKPTDLMRWLCRLVTPRGGLVLDPFAGSGSTGRGAIAEGMRFVGIELDPEYAAIAEARIRAMQPGLALGATA